MKSSKPTYLVFDPRKNEILYKGKSQDKSENIAQEHSVSGADIEWRKYTPIKGRGQVQVLSIAYSDGSARGVFGGGYLNKGDLEILTNMLSKEKKHV